MKTQTLRRPRRGFTLVELLVVIAIIAVLAAMGFAGAQVAINRAKKLKAAKVCTTLDQAVLSFYDSYGHLPAIGVGDSGQERPVSTDTPEGIELINILVGSDLGQEENPKRIRFLEVRETKNNRDGMLYAATGNNVEGLYDPWGGPYYILLDTNYDETLEDPFSRGEYLRGRRVASYSYGKNGSADFGGKDDVKSW